ncbi:uncharacterized protein LOC127290531 [Leptopilina boulardi]|uniref:uncharacterized protein LOC127290531 n=1 Tax=Leptopilina boulardi TaxID=63433 RepID=UPI0021F55B63|nr:uncharacterized protein LOC127290531 [Leptopilina boulardi]
MKNFQIFVILAIFFVSVKSDFWSDYNKRLQNSDFGIRKPIQHRPTYTDTETKNKNTLSRNEILKIADQVENGNPPYNLKSSNTNIQTMTVNGKPRIVKTIVFSIGNNLEGTKYTVKNTYQDSIKIGSSISTSSWNNKETKSYSYHSK